MNILQHENLDLFTHMSDDLEVTLADILATKFSSYKLAQDTSKSLFNRQGKSRQEYIPDSDLDEDEQIEDPIISTMDEELYRILISEINLFLQSLEKSHEENKLKSLIIKFLNSNLYQSFPDLYRPKEYDHIIQDLLDLPNRFRNYYLQVIDELRILSPESPLISKLEQQGNQLILNDPKNVRELQSSSQPVRDLFNRHRKELKKIISPEIAFLREKFDMPHTTYVQNISKVINELSSKLEEDELMTRFSKIILS